MKLLKATSSRGGIFNKIKQMMDKKKMMMSDEDMKKEEMHKEKMPMMSEKEMHTAKHKKSIK